MCFLGSGSSTAFCSACRSEFGAELLSDLADVTDAEFAECGIPQVKGEWLRSQAQAAVRGGGGAAASGIPEGVPKEDEDDGV